MKDTGWAFAYLIGGLLVALFSVGILENNPRFVALGMLKVEAVEAGVIVAVFGLLTWLIGSKALHFRREDFGPSTAREGLRRCGGGFSVGLVLAIVTMAIAVPLGHAAWRADGGSLTSWLGRVAVTGLVLLPAALGEELAFRGVPMLALRRAWGRLPALIVPAVLFALVHLDNNGVTLLAVLNIMIAGILLGVAFFTPGGLWISTGIHLGWNLTLAALAAPVSGIDVAMPGIDYLSGRPSWLTGGAFGPEGGVLASLCLMAGLCFISRRNRGGARA